jgi:hypothetical protein
MPRFICFAILALHFTAPGCAPNAVETKKADQDSSGKSNSSPKSQTEPAPSVVKSKLSKASSTVAATGLGVRAAMGQLQSRLEESLAAGPAEVIWVIDVSRSTERLRNDALPMIGAIHSAVKKKLTDSDCLVGIVSVSDESKWELEPTAFDAAAIEARFAKLSSSSSSTEKLFGAIRLASEKATDARRKGREVMLVLLTDEAGDDGDTVDEVLAPLKKFGIPVFVIGIPAPFGRASVSSASIELPGKPATDIDPKIMHEGPETLEPEVVDLSFSGSDVSFDLMDSGFGPFALEKLCRASGGKYLALRYSPGDIDFTGIEIRWPNSSATRFSPDRMQAYAPEYGSPADYQAVIDSNRAARALIQAAKLPRIDTLGAVNTRFDKANEAQSKRRLDESQEAAAKIEPAITRLAEMLLSGEPDRDNLPSARWKAGFDLALGRALAAKARVDGYNNMLATLKRGRNFQNPASKAWRLEASKDATEAGSSIQSMVKKANMLLNRVIQEHPETPWAEMAKRELEAPLGWKWVEE